VTGHVNTPAMERHNSLVKHRLRAECLKVRFAIWPQEVQNETRSRDVCATEPTRSGSR
jgi:hypothetical protein